MKKVLIKVLDTIAGKKRYQNLFENLYQLSLRGMNVGGGAPTDTSGERFAIEYVHRKLSNRTNLTIFDVGANVGNYSLLLKEIFKEKGLIFSFEPSLKTFQKLVSNTKHINSLHLHNLGFGNADSKITLFSNQEESGLASLYKRRLDHFNIEMNKTEEIEIKTIDAFCRENSIQHIHFLKIDVEGHEMKVLEGAKTLINSKNIDFIQFEFGGTNIDSRTFFQDFFYLLKDNYNIYRVLKDGLYRIKEYKERYEAFNATNYLAERIDV